MTNNILPSSANNSPSKNLNRLPGVLPYLLVASLTLPPIVLILFYPGCSPVSLHLKMWGIEYQLEKGGCTVPLEQHRQLESGQSEQ